MAEARERALKDLNQRWRRRDLRKLTFEEYFTAGAESWAEELARPHGLADACRTRGFDGLLKVPAVRLTVGVLLSEIFAQVVDERQATGQLCLRPLAGDPGLHGLRVGAKDGRFAKHIRSIPGVPIVQRVTSMRELLDTLR
jgi:hypothetical protein